jgi:UDP-2-acetamido-2,6-beta-L-arabino-hexul-4-ose reductase
MGEPAALAEAINGAERVVHLAGVNRGSDEEVRGGNLDPADALGRALRSCTTPPKTLVFANSTQAGNGTVYGDAKAAAAQKLADATRWSGSAFVDMRLPNVYGEHGRPHYNSVVATFCRVLADGGAPRVAEDRELQLVHATDAAAAFLGVAETPTPHLRTVRQLEGQLRGYANEYATGTVPALRSGFDVRLFNTYRSHCFPAHYPIELTRHDDQRGELVEAVRVRDGGGQTFCSSTRPGATRGEHYHLAKVERFVVVRGKAQIALRRLWHDEIERFDVSGEVPVAIDMPTMWTHRITNIGDGELVTLFWSNELFDATNSDTHPEPVALS